MNWKSRLEHAEKKGFTVEDKVLAQLWITDPLSEFVDVIEWKNGNISLGPCDIHLILDGIFFTKGVDEDDWDLAYHCYLSMIKRVQQLGIEE